MCEDSIGWAFIIWAGAILAALALAFCSLWFMRAMAEAWFWISYRRSQRKARAETVADKSWLVGEPPQGLPILAKLHPGGVVIGYVQGRRFHSQGFTCPAENVLGWIRVPGSRARKEGANHG